MMLGRRAARQLPCVLQHAPTVESAVAFAFDSNAGSMQDGRRHSAGDAGSCRRFSSDEQPAEQPKLATGLSMVKGGTDPPLLPDGEYPSWLWQLGETRPPLSQLRRAKEDDLTFEQHERQLKLENRELIRDRNASKAKKQ